jgi:hypothetical protein
MELVKDEVSKSYSGTVDADTVIEVGDSKDPSRFYPQVKLLKWENEVNLSVRLVTAEAGKDETVTAEKAVWNNTVIKAEFYSKVPDAEHPAGGFEFAVTLKERPVSDTLSFSVVVKDAVFVRQPPLTELIGQEGIVTATETEGFDGDGNPIAGRPENVVNSLAVYHAASPLNIAGGKEYRTGKIGHIYRPKAIEAGGRETWCDMAYDERTRVLSITVPKEFLDSALYPVIVDPTFGYTTIGGTTVTVNANSLCHVGTGLLSPSSGYNRVIKFTVYGSNNGTPGSTINFAAYTIVAGTPSARLAAGVAITLPSVAGWTDSAAVSQVLTTGSTYGVAEGGAGNNLLNFDTGTGNQRSSANGSLPDPWVHTSYSSAFYSWYATYEEVYTNMMQIQDD